MADAETPETKPQPPPMIGSYRLIQPLGSGGMSSVFLARHADTDHEVAVKVLPRYLAKNPTLLQRFTREAKSAESLEHPNIVAIYDRGSESGRYYLVLEYVPGGDLHDRVREKGPMPVDLCIETMLQVCQGLNHAAGRGLIHRDIKPANILMTPEGKVKITDLGLALHIEEEDERVTRDGTTVGTVDYMAPEQARDSRAASIRSDMYSLGCTLYFLLTGQAPFSGSDVAEKLRSHAIEPPPDIRQIRPDAPELFAQLVQKMMAKRPEKRYRDYEHLIQAFEAVKAAMHGGTAAAKPGPLYALIDDDDDLPPLPVDPSAPLYALIDEDDADEEYRLTLGNGNHAIPEGSTGSAHIASLWPEGDAPRSSGIPAELNLSALAGIEDDSPSLLRPARSPASRPTLAAPIPDLEDIPAPEDPYGLEDPIGPGSGLIYERQPPPGTPASTWIARFVILGVFAAIGLAVWAWLPPELLSGGTPVQPVDLTDGGDNKVQNTGPSTIPPWTEPSDSERRPVAESPPASETLTRLAMNGVEEETAPRAEAPFVEVRRVDRLRDREHVPDLRRAFDSLGGTVEILDSGPFFEQDFRIYGANRVVRTRSGFRPIVVLESAHNDSVQTSSAVFSLEGRRSLFLEGIDFVIKASDLGPKQASLFSCQESDLTLRDCTVTIVGPLPHPFAVIQMGEPGSASGPIPARVKLERTLIRGAMTEAVRLSGAGELTIANSAILSGSGEVVEISGGVGDARTITIYRSTLASPGAIFELAGAAGSTQATPATVKSLDSKFCHIENASPALMVGLRDIPAGGTRKTALFDWSGDENTFIGLKAWSSSSPPGLLAGLRLAAPSSDKGSVEEKAPLPASLQDPWAKIATGGLIPTSTALPSPYLREKSVESFGRREITERPAAKAIELKFEAGEPNDSHDLGAFLTENLQGKAGHVRVQVSGKGTLQMTPVKAPEGVSLEIDIDPSSTLSLISEEDCAGEALFSVHHAELKLVNVRLIHDARSPGLKALVSVDHGTLSLDRCVLTASKEAEITGSRLVNFRGDGTRPYPPGGSSSQGPLCRLTDCVLISGGNAMWVELGRGAVVLSNCAIAAGKTAIELRPEDVRRDRFESDLRMDRCTIAAEQTILSVSAWRGMEPGPDRPWLVSSRSCVFLDTYERGGTPSSTVLLRTTPDGLSRGVLSWESADDVFDVAHFSVEGDAPPPSIARPDVQTQWAKLWGRNHMKNASGPRPNGIGSNVHLLVSKLKPGNVQPGDFALDPNYPPGRKSIEVGADLAKMGILGPK